MSDEAIDLSKNEFLFDHPLLITDSLPRLSAKEICQYHLNPRLIAKLAEHHNIDPECIILCNGAEHGLKITFSAVAGMKGAVLLLPAPSWEYYWKLAAEYKVEIDSYDYKEGSDGVFVPDMENLEVKIKSIPKPVLLVSSPSNPLGGRLDDKVMRGLTELVGKKGYTLYDQTYLGYSGGHEPSLLETITELSRTLVIRSLSKYYGMPGLRVGFIAGTASVRKAFSIPGDYLGFNAFSDAFATECLSRHDEFAKIADQVVKNRERLNDFFSSLQGFKPFQSSANFILVRVPNEEYAPYLLSNGMKVKCFSEGELKSYVRITIPPLRIVERIESLTTKLCIEKRLGSIRPEDGYETGGSEIKYTR
jgi:histidinol-phosphate aminotransferase